MARSQVFARVVLGGFAACCALVLSVAFLRGSESLVAYVAPIAGLTMVAVVTRLDAGVRVNVALALLTLGVSTYLAEGALFVAERGHYSRFLGFETARIRAAQSQGEPFDTRTRLRLLDDLEGENIRAVGRIHPGVFSPTNGLQVDGGRIFPLSGLSGTVTVTCNESGQWAIIETDEHGFRNPLGVFDVDTMDIVVLGDSFAFGSCAEEGEDTPSVLRDSGRHVVNLGYGGNGPMVMLASLKEYAEPFQPRVVLWFYYEGNDLYNLSTEQSASLLMNYRDPTFTQGLLGRRDALDRALEDFYTKEKALARQTQGKRVRCVALLCGLRNLFRRPGNPEAQSYGDMVPILGEVVSEARDRVNGWGGEFYFVYLPAWQRYGDTARTSSVDREAVLAVLDGASIDVIDFAAEMDAHPDPLSLFPFRLLGHYTAEGYALLGRQILDHLARAGGT